MPDCRPEPMTLAVRVNMMIPTVLSSCAKVCEHCSHVSLQTSSQDLKINWIMLILSIYYTQYNSTSILDMNNIFINELRMDLDSFLWLKMKKSTITFVQNFLQRRWFKAVNFPALFKFDSPFVNPLQVASPGNGLMNIRESPGLLRDPNQSQALQWNLAAVGQISMLSSICLIFCLGEWRDRFHFLSSDS